MLLSTCTVSWIASSLLLCAGLVDSRAIEELVKRVAVPGNATSVNFDSVTHKLVFGYSHAVSKRDSESESHRILAILGAHDGHSWCKEYCPNEYASKKPVTVYKTTTKSVEVDKTKTSTLGPSTTTKVITGSPSLASTVTSVSTIHISTTSTLEATPITIDVEQTSVITDYETLTSELPIQTITALATLTATIVDTITGPQVTTTIDITAVSTVTLAPRNDNRLPSWLNDHRSDDVVDACKKLVLPPQQSTTTVLVTKYETFTKFKTTSIGGVHVTKTTTIHPAASTVTKKTSTTVVASFLATHTFVTTETETTLTTQYLTLIETETPSPVTLASTVLTTITTTTTAPGSTYTACQNAVYGIQGGGLPSGTPGNLNEGAATTITGCCTECYDTAGCTGWIYFSGVACFLGATPSTGTATSSTCPAGLEPFFLLSGTNSDLFAGGPGPCITTLTID